MIRRRNYRPSQLRRQLRQRMQPQRRACKERGLCRAYLGAMSERPNNNALSSCFQTLNSCSSQGIDVGPWKWRNRAEGAQLERRYVWLRVFQQDMTDTRGPRPQAQTTRRSKFAITILR